MWSVTEEAGTSLDPFWRSLVRPGLLLLLLFALCYFLRIPLTCILWTVRRRGSRDRGGAASTTAVSKSGAKEAAAMSKPSAMPGCRLEGQIKDRRGKACNISGHGQRMPFSNVEH